MPESYDVGSELPAGGERPSPRRSVGRTSGPRRRSGTPGEISLDEDFVPIGADLPILDEWADRPIVENLSAGPDTAIVRHIEHRDPLAEDKIRGVLAFIIVVAFLVIASTSMVSANVAKPVMFVLGAMGSWMVRPVINFYFPRRSA